jgi:hypothetical protein
MTRVTDRKGGAQIGFFEERSILLSLLPLPLSTDEFDSTSPS